MQQQMQPLTSLILYIALILYFSTSAASERHSVIKPKVINDEFYSETYTLFSDMDNGEYIYAQIGVSNIGPGDENGFCRIMYFQPGMKTINKSILLKNTEWRHEANPDQVLRIGNCALTLSKTQQLSFIGRIDELSIQIKLSQKVKPLSPPSNKINKNDASYFTELLIPWSKAKASAGNTKKHIELGSIDGYGYADHSISTFLPSNLASKWIRFRAINEDDSSLFLARYSDENRKPESWLLQQGLPVLKSNSINEFHSTLPRIDFEAATKKYTIAAENLIYRQATLEENGLLGKVISKLVGNPVTYTYRASMMKSGKKIKGILEVSIANE